MPENDLPAEGKALFVERLNETLITCGTGRYGYPRETLMEYAPGDDVSTWPAATAKQERPGTRCRP